jgi:hypothetical protein
MLLRKCGQKLCNFFIVKDAINLAYLECQVLDADEVSC